MTSRDDGRDLLKVYPRTQPVYPWSELRERWGDGLHTPSTRFHVFRHGETVLNRKDRISGSLNTQLTREGRAQAEALGERFLPEYDLVFSSAMDRARETLDVALASTQRDRRYVIDWRINERGLGRLEGTQQRFIEELSRGDIDWAPPGGESYREMAQRCMSFLIDVFDFLSAVPDEAPFSILISAHMGPLRFLSGLFDEVTQPQEWMAYHFENTHLVEARAQEIAWPAYL